MTEKSLPLAAYLPNVSRIASGCMGLGGGWNHQLVTKQDIRQGIELVEAALDSGINLFDHADIYTFGKAERVFGEVLKQQPDWRKLLYIQSKCGIRLPDEQQVGRYDFSADWVNHSVDGSLQRLGIEKLDILLLHRPDPLQPLDELAEALTDLHRAGKVDFFGVSNMSHHQLSFLTAQTGLPFIINQLEMSLKKLDWLNQGVLVNTPGYHQVDFPAGTLEYCQQQGVQIQAWGCLAQGLYSKNANDIASESAKQTAVYVQQLAADYGTSVEAIVLAFLLRHPASIQPVTGTTNPARIRACAAATNIRLTREQWYRLFVLSRGERLP